MDSSDLGPRSTDHETQGERSSPGRTEPLRLNHSSARAPDQEPSEHVDAPNSIKETGGDFSSENPKEKDFTLHEDLRVSSDDYDLFESTHSDSDEYGGPRTSEMVPASSRHDPSFSPPSRPRKTSERSSTSRTKSKIKEKERLDEIALKSELSKIV